MLGDGLVVSPAARAYVTAISRRLREDPNDSEALFGGTVLLAAAGRWEDAIACLEGLAHVDPHYPGLWRFKARLHRESGDPRMEKLCLRAAEREESMKAAAPTVEVPRPSGRNRRRRRGRRVV